MYLQSIIVTLALGVLGAEQVEQDELTYFASSFQDLEKLAKQEIMLIHHLKTIQESITQQLKTQRIQCQEENKFSITDIVDISRTLPSEHDIRGRTIFPQLGISVKPVAGSALMWVNIRSNGLFDAKVGNKWIANKWVLWADQMFHYSCDRNRAEHYSLRGSVT